MSSRLPFPGKPPYCAAHFAATLRPEPPDDATDLGDHDTIAVPLASADTLPCPRLDLEDRPTLRMEPRELAVLVALTKPPHAKTWAAQAVQPAPRQYLHPAFRTAAVRLPDPGPDVPTQLWFAPLAPRVLARPGQRSWWARLCSLLGFVRSAQRRTPARYPGYHRRPFM